MDMWKGVYYSKLLIILFLVGPANNFSVAQFTMSGKVRHMTPDYNN